MAGCGSAWRDPVLPQILGAALMLFADARLGDIVDVSQLLEELQRDVAVQRVCRELRARPGVTECVSCGDTISPARLEALPAAQRCTDCQFTHEKSRR